jgi:hypothetical protein
LTDDGRIVHDERGHEDGRRNSPRVRSCHRISRKMRNIPR